MLTQRSCVHWGAIKENSKDNQFTFESISKSDIKKEILNPNSTKAIQGSIYQEKNIKQNAAVFTEYLFCKFSRSLEVSGFRS